GPPLGGLGPGPVDAADGDPQLRPVDGPGARRQVGAVAAPGPGLGRPVPVDVVADVAGPLAERAGEHVDDHVAALLPGPGAGGDGGGALEEPGDDAGRAGRRRAVEGDADGLVRAEDGAREPLGAPPRLVVD